MMTALLLSLALFAQNPPDVSRDGIGKTRRWAHDRITQAENAYADRHLASPEFWGREVVYQIQVDRFNNGDPTNDLLNVEPAQARGDLERILDFRHGGDLRGVTERLDYLKDLGVTVLWLTPFLRHNGAYHGYCTTDPTRVDPGFGDLADFRELVRRAHARGIRVVMDVVVNHLCDVRTVYARAANHYACAGNADAKNWSGVTGGFDGQGDLAFSPDFFGPLKSPHFFNRCGANSDADMRGTGPAAVYGDFVEGMFDYDTRNQDFQVIFTDLFKWWIAATDVDGFRLDAAKHVTEDFVAYFSTETRAYARTLGKENFFVIGEVAAGGDWIRRRLGRMQDSDLPRTLLGRLSDLRATFSAHPRSPYPGLDAVYEFAQGGTAVDVLRGTRPTRAFEDHFAGDFAGAISSQNDHRLSWNLLEIHDWPRFARGGMAKSILGAAYLAFAEGSPVVYYGFEQGFDGVCRDRRCAGGGDALHRQDMFAGGMSLLGSVVPDIDRLSYVGLPRASRGNADPFLNQEHALYQSTRRFLAIRRSCSALGFGHTRFRWSEDGGLLAFSRVDAVNGSEALVIFNAGERARALPRLRVDAGAMRWRNLLNGKEEAVGQGGMLDFGGVQIAPDHAMVFVPEDRVGPYDAHLETYLCRE